MREGSSSGSGHTGEAGPPRPSQARELARDLTGDLPCSRCGYNLRGLSIRAGCPECGLPVKTTILVLVDPKADELVPLAAPARTAWGMVLWIGGALGCALGVWLLRLAEWLDARHGVSWPSSDIAWVALGMMAVSAVGALALIRPHRAVPPGRSRLTALGCLLYVPLAFVFHRVHLVLDWRDDQPYTGGFWFSEERAAWRLVFAVLAVAMVLLLRSSARHLAARSFVFRTGQIDRQSLLAIVGAFAVAALGDAARLLLPPSSGGTFALGVISLIALGSFLLTLGLFAAFVDTVRLRSVLAREQVGLSSILESNAERERRAAGMTP